MPATHYESFKVRYHECDAFGILKPINLFRWLQESAFAASGAVGYDFARYDQIGHLWLVRETDVESLGVLKQGDRVEIKTWIMDFRRFRSRRAYEVRNTLKGELAARASTDWVYLEAESLRPVMIPEEMQAAFSPEGPPEKPAHRRRTPKPASPPAEAVSFRTVVGWNDIDMMWHVNNAKYLAYMDGAEKRACALVGWPMQRMMAERVRIDTRQHTITYHQPAKLGDELEVATWCSDFIQGRALRHFEISRSSDGALIVQARSRWGWVDLDTGEAVGIPEDFSNGSAV